MIIVVGGFLLFYFYRLILLSHERRRMKVALEQKYDQKEARKYRFMRLWEWLVYGMWIMVSVYFIYFFLVGF